MTPDQLPACCQHALDDPMLTLPVRIDEARALALLIDEHFEDAGNVADAIRQHANRMETAYAHQIHSEH